MSTPTLPGRQGSHKHTVAQTGQEPVPPATADREVPVQRSAPSGDRHLGEHQLLTGYLAAVALRLDQRGIAVRETRAATLDVGALTAWMSLRPPRCGAGHWVPIRLDWREDRGWSATLAPPAERATTPGHDDRVSRYLPRQLVPAPTAVAHFVAALNADEATPWASAIYRQPRHIDRRLLILRLSQFGLPEPW